MTISDLRHSNDPMYQLHNNNQLQLKGQPLFLKVTTMQGNTIAVEVGSGNTVAELKEIVADRLAVDHVKLNYMQDFLVQDSSTLETSGLKAGSTLYAMHRL